MSNLWIHLAVLPQVLAGGVGIILLAHVGLLKKTRKRTAGGLIRYLDNRFGQVKGDIKKGAAASPNGPRNLTGANVQCPVFIQTKVVWGNTEQDDTG